MGKRLTTTKAGCKTCKARKIKCDLGRPTCRRCTSTGRQCGGYGVWDQLQHRKLQPDRIACKSIALYSSIPNSTLRQLVSSETLAFDWFVNQTLGKLPGPFALGYWRELVVQSALQEPALIYAVLALSELHRLRSSDTFAEDHIVVRHYITAISYLNRRFQSSSTEANNIALLACIAFVNLELLHDRFRTAEEHLGSGIRILCESSFVRGDDCSVELLPNASVAKEGIFRAFARCSLLIELFYCTHNRPRIAFVLRAEKGNDAPIDNLHSAWNSLEVILHALLDLKRIITHTIDYQHVCSSSPSQRRLEKLRTELTRWRAKFDALSPPRSTDLREQVLSHLLSMWYHMISIMVDSCCSEDELVYDDLLDKFVDLVDHASISRRLRLPNTPITIRAQPGFNMSHSLVDVGWIPPLYYSAVKCRDFDLRIRAIGLIESASHREGIWDSRISSAIAKQVVAIEHGELQSYVESSRRIKDFRVVLPNGPVEHIEMFYHQASAAATVKCLIIPEVGSSLIPKNTSAVM